jgi:hypothetical protein
VTERGGSDAGAEDNKDAARERQSAERPAADVGLAEARAEAAVGGVGVGGHGGEEGAREAELRSRLLTRLVGILSQVSMALLRLC